MNNERGDVVILPLVLVAAMMWSFYLMGKTDQHQEAKHRTRKVDPLSVPYK